MPLEIERKFLVKDESYKSIASVSVNIEQGYLCREPEKTVRVRIKGERGFLTVKGITRNASREEYEYEIPFQDAVSILRLCGGDILSKTRWYVNEGRYVWEVDEFHGALEGLTVAEIELTDVNDTFELPAFIGREVTDDARYYNSALIGASQVPEV